MKKEPLSVTETRFIVYSRPENDLTRRLQGAGVEGWIRGVGFAQEALAQQEFKWLKKNNPKACPREYKLVAIKITKVVQDLNDEIPF